MTTTTASLSSGVLSVLALCSCLAASAEPSTADERLEALYEAEWAWRVEELAVDPEGGRAQRDRFPRVDPASQQRRLEYWSNALEELRAIPYEQLSKEETINADVFRAALEAFVADIRFREYEDAFGFWRRMAPRQGYGSVQEYRAYLGRLRDMPRYVDEQIANMRAGLDRGFTRPRVSIEGRERMIESLAASEPADSPLYTPFTDMPSSIPDGARPALIAEGEAIIRSEVAPAFAKLHAFVRDEYIPNARTTTAAEALPDGKAWYEAKIREYTTLDLSAEEIHQTGLREVARIEADMHATMKEAAWEGDFQAFLDFLKSDPQFYAETPYELIAKSAYVANKVNGQLKFVIGLLPRYRFTILPTPAAVAPFDTGGKGGLESCLMNTYDLPSRPLYTIPPLTLHECAPGHSFQAALALEGPERPPIRKSTYFSGYGEGWALYMEWLGTKMGIYETPYEEFGRQTYEMWRAARLVVDTGLHRMGWTREQALDYLGSRTALSDHEVRIEVDRYINTPAQALAYKLGELLIRRKRAEAEEQLGADFDQRWFHDVILGLGSVPLPTLERVLDDWIAGGGKNPHVTLTAGSAASAAPGVSASPSRPAIRTIEHRTRTFLAALHRDTQTLARLSPLSGSSFDFTPGGRDAERQGDGYVHLGDLHLRVRSEGGGWLDFSSSRSRQPLRVLPTTGRELAAADITATMGTGLPLSVERRWSHEDEALVLRFVLANDSPRAVDIGALGLPMVFDNILTDRSLEEAHAEASFVDPYIGRDGGYLQVTRLNGEGPALLVLPDGRTPLEAYRPILEEGEAPADDAFTDRTPRAQTFEGFYDWMVASRGFLENEWKDAGEQWNEATIIRLAPGESIRVGVRFVLSPSIRAIEDVLAAQGRPVAVGIPGYVVPTDLPATLFLNSPEEVRGVDVHPAGALTVESTGEVNGWKRYKVRGERWGRARMSITYADGSVQTVHYFVTKPAIEAVADLGRFITTRQFYDDEDDPFGRAPAILSYDRETNRILTQEARVWIAGMSDEGGAGSWVAAMMKQLDNPAAEEIAKLERVVTETVVGKLQVAGGKHAGGVRKSLFYHEPEQHSGYYDPSIDWQSWTAWSKEEAHSLVRSYNYPHVAAGHWVLYRLARNRQGLVKAHDWRWYLERAYLTAVAMVREAPRYAQFGQMEGEVFLEILKDLQREGMTAQADELEALMKERADHWMSLPYPFGSEMAWDSTGQPEIHAWLRYFGHEEAAARTREAILGYDPAIPHWGYNGNARRYWDFLYAGKLRRLERQIHHYGSALNAVPLFDAYRADPQDFHLLRVAYGGLMGGLTNIDQEGFGSAAFHAYPDAMRFDGITGDYGMGFFGHAYATATYLVEHPAFGWLGFGGVVSHAGERVRIEPRDSGRSRLFVAPAGLWLTLQAGTIRSAEYSPATGVLRMKLAPADAHTRAARLAVETTHGGRSYAPEGVPLERGLYTIPLHDEPTLVVLSQR